MSTAPSPHEIATSVIGSGPDTVLNTHNSQATHRFAIADAWNIIKVGDTILELGCGQGDMTAALATRVGPTGHIVALDPAEPSGYGSPWTLKQAQEHLSGTSIGNRIEWVHADTLDYLEKARAGSQHFDSVVLAHSLWYFPSPKAIDDTLAAIRKLDGSPRLLIAEYALEARHPEATPHLLAALTQGALETHKPVSESNIRTIVSPRSLRDRMGRTGWKLISEQIITPHSAYEDGKWEIGMVTNERFLKEIDQVIVDERERSVVLALRDAMLSSMAQFERKDWRSMDVWVATFE